MLRFPDIADDGAEAGPSAASPGDEGADGDMGIPASALAALVAVPEGGADARGEAAGDAIAGESDGGGGAKPPEVWALAAPAPALAPAKEAAAILVAPPTA